MDTLDNNITSQENLRIGAADKQNLNEMVRWARFIAIVGFVMLGIMALAMVSMLSLSSSNPFMRNSDASPVLMALIFLLGIAIYFFPIYYLFKAAKGIKRGLNSNDEVSLSDGFANLKSHYKFIGILMVVVLSLYALAILIGVGIGLSGF